MLVSSSFTISLCDESSAREQGSLCTRLHTHGHRRQLNTRYITRGDVLSSLGEGHPSVGHRSGEVVAGATGRLCPDRRVGPLFDLIVGASAAGRNIIGGGKDWIDGGGGRCQGCATVLCCWLREKCRGQCTVRCRSSFSSLGWRVWRRGSRVVRCRVCCRRRRANSLFYILSGLSVVLGLSFLVEIPSTTQQSVMALNWWMLPASGPVNCAPSAAVHTSSSLLTLTAIESNQKPLARKIQVSAPTE